MEKDTIFFDTGAWYALADRSDKHHKDASALFPKLLENLHHLTTTNMVIAETYTLIRRSMGYQPAIEFLQNIQASPRVTKIYSDSSLELTAEELLRKYEDQDFSYTDAVSFTVMKHYKILKAFSFDQHFQIAGFILIP